VVMEISAVLIGLQLTIMAPVETGWTSENNCRQLSQLADPAATTVMGKESSRANQ
jgi:hypothetical protein